MSGSAAPWGKLCLIPARGGGWFTPHRGVASNRKIRRDCKKLLAGGLKSSFTFVKFRSGRFAVPRFSSLSGALMCDSKKGLRPRLRAGVFFTYGPLRLTLPFSQS